MKKMTKLCKKILSVSLAGAVMFGACAFFQPVAESFASVQVNAATYGDFRYKTDSADKTGKSVIIYGYTGVDTKLVIPAKLDGFKVTGIEGSDDSEHDNILLGDHFYYYDDDWDEHCRVTSVTLPKGLKTIGNGAFDDFYDMGSLNIPETVTSIGESAFESCYALKKLILPASVSEVGYNAFDGSGIQDLWVYNDNLELYTDVPENAVIHAHYGSEAHKFVIANSDCGYVFKQIPIIKATAVKLSKTSLTLEKGKSATLAATIAPANVTDKKVTWTSSNTKVATVVNGKVTAKAVGTATITAKTANGKTAACKVTVQVSPTSVKLNKTSLTLEKGKSETLTATIAPTNATVKTVTWTSSDSKVASVVNGKVTAKAKGTATITAKTANGKTAACKVTVTEPVTTIIMGYLMKVGTTAELYVDVTGSATANDVKWYSSNSKVISVVKGKLTAKAVGTVIITAKTPDGKAVRCRVKAVK